MDVKENLQIMKVSLRVLACVNDRATPDPADVDHLRYYLGSQAPPVDLDELACAVIQKALERRARMRTAQKAIERISHLETVLVYSPHAPDTPTSLLGRDSASGRGMARLHAEPKSAAQQ